MNREDKQTALIIAAIILLIMSLPGIWIFQSHMEAKAYNEVTGSKVTTWQAMWIELRVQSGPGNNESSGR